MVSSNLTSSLFLLGFFLSFHPTYSRPAIFTSLENGAKASSDFKGAIPTAGDGQGLLHSADALGATSDLHKTHSNPLLESGSKIDGGNPSAGSPSFEDIRNPLTQPNSHPEFPHTKNGDLGGDAKKGFETDQPHGHQNSGGSEKKPTGEENQVHNQQKENLENQNPEGQTHSKKEEVHQSEQNLKSSKDVEQENQIAKSEQTVKGSKDVKNQKQNLRSHPFDKQTRTQRFLINPMKKVWRSITYPFKKLTQRFKSALQKYNAASKKSETKPSKESEVKKESKEGSENLSGEKTKAPESNPKQSTSSKTLENENRLPKSGSSNQETRSPTFWNKSFKLINEPIDKISQRFKSAQQKYNAASKNPESKISKESEVQKGSKEGSEKISGEKTKVPESNPRQSPSSDGEKPISDQKSPQVTENPQSSPPLNSESSKPIQNQPPASEKTKIENPKFEPEKNTKPEGNDKEA